jgi:tRNA dimethylallyltransferase
MADQLDDKNPLLIILGPTAVGKTELSINISREINVEIISADSMQIYQGMDIGTAKAKSDIRKKIPHHLIDEFTPEETFSVANFKDRVDKLIPEIISRGNWPMLVGGTGLYINAVVEGFMLPEMEPDEKLRSKLRQGAEEKGNRFIHNKLKEIDPILAEKLHPNDLRRVIRGIEIYSQTGKTKTYYREKQEKRPPRYNALKIGLTREREELYQRINCRVDNMIEEGLLQEVEVLLKQYDLGKTAKQALGYKELIMFLNNEIEFDEAVRLIKRDTRHLAKKQLTFFNRDEEIEWFNLSNINNNCLFDQVLNEIKSNYSLNLN